MDEAFRNILAFTGCTVPEAARMASTGPARLVGEGRRKGRLIPGYDADVTVISPTSPSRPSGGAAGTCTPGRGLEADLGRRDGRVRPRGHNGAGRRGRRGQRGQRPIGTGRWCSGGHPPRRRSWARRGGHAPRAHRPRGGRHNRRPRAAQPVRDPHPRPRLRPGPARRRSCWPAATATR
jgi:hypothetical protein